MSAVAATDRRVSDYVPEPAFARHETFHPRFGWLRKGYVAAAALPDLFIREDAPALLGVGKNMVRAIRYWCLAYKVLREEPNKERPRLKDALPTSVGSKLFIEDGWDPYLERTGSLWLLHWQLLKPSCSAPSWFVAFNHFPQVEFSHEDLFLTLRAYRDKTEAYEGIVDSSLKKDIDCLLRMFAGATNSGTVLEDTLDSPFVDLDLIRRTPGSRRHFSFNLGPKPSLPDDLVVYACADFMDSVGLSARTVNVTSLVHSLGSPGLAFKLTETALFEALDRYADGSKLIDVDSAAGVRQLILHKDPQGVAEAVLRRFYQRSEGWIV